MTAFKGQTENAGHFWHPTTRAIGHRVILRLPFWVLRGGPTMGLESILFPTKLARHILPEFHQRRETRVVDQAFPGVAKRWVFDATNSPILVVVTPWRCLDRLSHQ